MADDLPPEDAGPPPTGGPPTSDPGPAEHARLDGILDGRLGDERAVRAGVARANAAGYGRFDLEIDGGRFSILPDSDFVPADRMTDDRRRAYFDGLRDVAAASRTPVESTLRSVEVYRDVVRETLFVADGGALRALTRERPRTGADRAATADRDAPPPMGRGRIAVLGILFVIAFGLVAWTSGWIDRAMAPPAAEISVEHGVFGDLLDATVENSWGDYVVTVRRGPGYPATSARVDELERAAGTPAERAAVTAAATGGDLWIRLERADGRAIEAIRVPLRALVESADRTVEARVPGRSSGAALRLALDAGQEFK